MKKENVKETFFDRITDFSDWDKETWIYVIIFLLISLTTLYLFYRTYQEETFLFNLVVRYFARPISQLQEVGWLLFLAFMAIQGLLIPIPSELVLLSSGTIWGFELGGLLGLMGSMLTAIICYHVSKKGGRPIVKKIIGEENIETLDFFVKKYGGLLIFAARAFPFMAFDPISYISGLVEIDQKKYLTATFFGSIIRSFFYAWLGGSLIPKETKLADLSKTQVNNLIKTHSSRFNWLIIVLGAILIGGYAIYKYLVIPYLKSKQKKAK